MKRGGPNSATMSPLLSLSSTSKRGFKRREGEGSRRTNIIWKRERIEGGGGLPNDVMSVSFSYLLHPFDVVETAVGGKKKA